MNFRLDLNAKLHQKSKRARFTGTQLFIPEDNGEELGVCTIT